MTYNSVPGTDTCWRCFPNEIVQEWFTIMSQEPILAGDASRMRLCKNDS